MSEKLARKFWSLRTTGDIEDLPSWDDLPESERAAKIAAAEEFIEREVEPVVREKIRKLFMEQVAEYRREAGEEASGRYRRLLAARTIEAVTIAVFDSEEA